MSLSVGPQFLSYIFLCSSFIIKARKLKITRFLWARNLNAYSIWKSEWGRVIFLFYWLLIRKVEETHWLVGVTKPAFQHRIFSFVDDRLWPEHSDAWMTTSEDDCWIQWFHCCHCLMFLCPSQRFDKHLISFINRFMLRMPSAFQTCIEPWKHQSRADRRGGFGVRELAVETMYLIQVLRYMEKESANSGLTGGKARHSWEWGNPALWDNLVYGMREGAFCGEEIEYQMKFECILNTEGS